MAAIDFYFDYRSPYAYLAQPPLRQLGIEIAWRPFDIRQLMAQVGNVATSITCASKGRYIRLDLQRWAARYGVPLQRHAQADEVDGRRLLRATLAADQLGRAEAAIAAFFAAYWGGSGAPLVTSADVVALLNSAGVSAPDLLARQLRQVGVSFGLRG
jgi:2-hydroxychromene-2-carboxylate isomerase